MISKFSYLLWSLLNSGTSSVQFSRDMWEVRDACLSGQSGWGSERGWRTLWAACRLFCWHLLRSRAPNWKGWVLRAHCSDTQLFRSLVPRVMLPLAPLSSLLLFSGTPDQWLGQQLSSVNLADLSQGLKGSHPVAAVVTGVLSRMAMHRKYTLQQNLSSMLCWLAVCIPYGIVVWWGKWKAWHFNMS